MLTHADWIAARTKESQFDNLFNSEQSQDFIRPANSATRTASWRLGMNTIAPLTSVNESFSQYRSSDMSKATLISPLGQTCEIPLDDSPITHDFLRTRLVSILNLPTHSPILFQDRRIVPCGPVPSPSSTFAFICRPEFPDRSFPRCDYAVPLDLDRFPSRLPAAAFPDSLSEIEQKLREVGYQEVVDRFSRQLAARPYPEVREQDLPSGPLSSGEDAVRERVIAMDEEEDGVEGPVQRYEEEEEMNEGLYIGDDYEESCWPVQEAALKRLADLGYDRSTCRWILNATQWNQSSSSRLLAGLLHE
jgi:hypothetical protein